jgi:hypothetical protein
VGYKIIAKLITRWMNKFMPNIISIKQNAFVKGRAIGDCIGMANEMVQGIDKGLGI